MSRTAPKLSFEIKPICKTLNWCSVWLNNFLLSRDIQCAQRFLHIGGSCRVPSLSPKLYVGAFSKFPPGVQYIFVQSIYLQNFILVCSLSRKLYIFNQLYLLHFLLLSSLSIKLYIFPTLSAKLPFGTSYSCFLFLFFIISYYSRKRNNHRKSAI